MLLVPESLEPTKYKIEIKEYFDYPENDAGKRCFLNRKGSEINVTDARISNKKQNPYIKYSFPTAIGVND